MWHPRTFVAIGLVAMTSLSALAAKPVASAASAAVAKTAAKAASAAEGRINLNTASEAVLMKGLNIDAARAAAIIKKRPYDTPRQLVERSVMSNKDFKSIKDLVSAGPAAKPP